MIVKMESKDDVLMHYGVVGMKWGIRRYQPYPSDSKRKGVYTGEKNVGAQPLKYKSPTTRKVLNTAIRLAVMADPTGVAALAYNANQINNMRKTFDSKDYDKDFVKEKLSELKRKTDETDNIKKDVKAVNKTGAKGYVNNCLNCVAALEMRQRGYDVEARPRATGSGTDNYEKWFDGVKVNGCGAVRLNTESRKDWVLRGYDVLTKQLESKNPEGARGFIAFNWEGSTSGHTMSWKIESGEVKFYDAQSGGYDTDKSLSFSSQFYLWGRLDDLPVTESITDVVQSKGGKKK